MIDSGEEMDREEIDLISIACSDWMGTISPEFAKELGVDLDKLGKALQKLSRCDFIPGIPNDE